MCMTMFGWGDSNDCVRPCIKCKIENEGTYDQSYQVKERACEVAVRGDPKG